MSTQSELTHFLQHSRVVETSLKLVPVARTHWKIKSRCNLSLHINFEYLNCIFCGYRASEDSSFLKNSKFIVTQKIRIRG